MQSSTAVLKSGARQYRENPDFSQRGGARGGERREREKSGRGTEAGERKPPRCSQGRYRSQHAARGEGAVDIYRKRDRAAVTPSLPDGGSQPRARRQGSSTGSRRASPPSSLPKLSQGAGGTLNPPPSSPAGGTSDWTERTGRRVQRLRATAPLLQMGLALLFAKPGPRGDVLSSNQQLVCPGRR